MSDSDSVSFRPSPQPRSLYIHIPFCRHRCGYCNFTLVAGRDYLVDRYLTAIETEIGWLGHRYELDTVFLGGGTPSHLSAEQIDRLREILLSRFSFSDACEFTAECNPSDLTRECAKSLASCGVNRISLGVQSMNRHKLNVLERDHSKELVVEAVNQARRIAKSVSIDMIFATPNETLREWQADLEQAIGLKPEHFSTYELTYEKGTAFWTRRMHNQISSADEDLRCQMYEYAIDTLAAHGYQQYEISSFSKPGHECKHNSIYWSGKPYLAFGPGASRYVDGIRETNHQSTMRYLQLIESEVSPVADSDSLSNEDRARELLAIGLRRLRGVEFSKFEFQTKFDARKLLAAIESKLVIAKLLVLDDTTVRLTRKGVMVYDWIAAEIVNC